MCYEDALMAKGAAKEFAKPMGELLEWAKGQGLHFEILSVFRDPKKQAELLRRWNAGDRVGIKCKPAEKSLHSEMVGGKPASRAVDLHAKDPVLYSIGVEAKKYGIRWGGNWGDEVHFDGGVK